jgi:hypothetical protein
MQARRTFEHGPEGAWSSVAVHLAAAGVGKDGFYLTLFPDARPPAVVFLRGDQLAHLLDMAASSTINDQQLWEYVAKIPMEPLLPCRSLYPRLRALLVDCASNIRAQIRAQAERPVPRATPIAADESEVAPAGDLAPTGGSSGIP